MIGFVRSENCQKLIKYDGKELRISGIQANILDVPIQIGEFEQKYEKIREASEVAMALDDYQYGMCSILKGLAKDDPEWRKYNELRISTLQMITSFRLSLIASKEESAKKEELDKIVGKMKEALKVEQQAIPKDSVDGLSKKEVREDDIPRLDTWTISEAKK